MLTIVATPIGNLLDLPQRAIQAFAEADIIACEDTRQTRKLLSLTGTKVSARLIPYHDHNGKKKRPALLSAMRSGKNVVLVSDAGTPLISDPGFKLVAACYDDNIKITSIPGIARIASLQFESVLFLFSIASNGTSEKLTSSPST